MKAPHSREHHHPMAEINITPFVDVVLVLLIIFMVTAPMLQQGMSVDLPKAATKEMKQEADDLIVTIDNQQRIFLGDSNKALNMEQLTAKLASIFQTKEKKALLIKADEKLQYGKVVEVMATAQKLGVERIGMVTEP